MRQQQHTDYTHAGVDPLDRLVQLSQTLLDIAEKEKQSLRQNNVNLFEQLQEEKQPVSQEYITASEAFRAQILQHKNTPNATLTKLEKLQEKLQEKTKENNSIINEISYRQHYAHTGSTLFATQALGQDNTQMRANNYLQEPLSPYTQTHRGRA